MSLCCHLFVRWMYINVTNTTTTTFPHTILLTNRYQSMICIRHIHIHTLRTTEIIQIFRFCCFHCYSYHFMFCLTYKSIEFKFASLTSVYHGLAISDRSGTYSCVRTGNQFVKLKIQYNVK